MSRPARAPRLAGKIGVTLLCAYLLGVAFRIGGCYAPDARPRDEFPDRGPRVGEEFPSFTLHDLAGEPVGRNPVAGAPTVLIFVPSLDWSPPSKARVIDLVQVLAEQRDIPVAIVMTEAQATPRGLAFVRDRHPHVHFLIDTEGLTERLGLATKAPDGTSAALPATFVLDPSGIVRLRDVRRYARTWLAPEAILEMVTRLREALTA